MAYICFDKLNHVLIEDYDIVEAVINSNKVEQFYTSLLNIPRLEDLHPPFSRDEYHSPFKSCNHLYALFPSRHSSSILFGLFEARCYQLRCGLDPEGIPLQDTRIQELDYESSQRSTFDA